MEHPHDDPPWSIPIREAGPEIPRREATWIDRLPVVPMAVSAVALFVVVVAAVLVLDESPAVSGPEVLGSEQTMTTVTTTTVAEDTSLLPVAPGVTAASTSSTTPATVVEQPSPAPTVVAPPAPEPDDLPIRTPDDLAEGWVAQVSSVPSSAGGVALARSFETVRSTVPDAVIVRGSEWASLRDGFWVILRPGYDNAADALAACDGWGLEGRDNCFARHLAESDATERVCWRDESGSAAGDCG
ncbi:hypothetical protein [Actinospongicola halichondriae]|uniref:hypothetical protein n=1 Tax=Actinospongicola halichondriae TaxID=3236844 RepID=UPI003D525268